MREQLLGGVCMGDKHDGVYIVPLLALCHPLLTTLSGTHLHYSYAYVGAVAFL